MADNVLLNGYVLAPELAAEGIERRSAEAIRAFNAMVAADDRVESLMLPIADGLTIARERIAEEAHARTGFLDLGRLGLDELPAELCDLTHVRRLNLGNAASPPRESCTPNPMPNNSEKVE